MTKVTNLWLLYSQDVWDFCFMCSMRGIIYDSDVMIKGQRELRNKWSGYKTWQPMQTVLTPEKLEKIRSFERN
ncbi:MAG: hypothetical protein KME46_19205 [Brasilonema angustatum HA4187-MV1]|nr:hypothetical protein [Brasilonema angustatum HA4187-MV1]